MKKQLYILLCLAMFCACKKKENKTTEENPPSGNTTGTPIPTPEPTPKLKTMVVMAGGQTLTTTYSYSSDGKLVQRDFSTGTEKLTWSANQVVSQIYNGSGALSFTGTYNLNAKGQATSATIAGVNYTYEYDANDYLVKQTSDQNGANNVVVFTISSGNVVSSSTTVPGYNGTQTFEYYDDRKNTIGNENIGFSIFGKQNKQAEKNNSAVSSAGNYAYSSTYETDAKGRIIKRSMISGTTTWTHLFTYTD